MDIVLASHVIGQIFDEAARAHPSEACGILLGSVRGARVSIETLAIERNVHQSPERFFEIDPRALIDAHRAARNGGPRVLGYFHSHPRGAAQPSRIDAALAARDDAIWAIAAQRELTLWRAQTGGFAPLRYRVARPS